MAKQSTREDFEFLERAGRGASSVVFKARRKADGKVYCVKEIDMSAVVPEEEEQALREVQLLASFEHPYVIRYYDSFLDDEILHIVMEWAEHGTLNDRLKTPGNNALAEAQVWKWSLQIIVGLNHMHERKVLHRDLKSANVFITSKDDAKIGDLGVSRALNTMQEMAHTVVGTPYYLSPELCEGRPYNVKSDVWALGCIMFEMCSGGAMPFQASNQGALILKILSGKQAPLPQGRYSSDLDDLITRCLTKAWQRRPDTHEILARQDVTKHARELQITLAAEQRRGMSGRELQEAVLSRLHSAPAAPQSREGGQRPNYLGSEDLEGEAYSNNRHRMSLYQIDQGSFSNTTGSSGTDPSPAESPNKGVMQDGAQDIGGLEPGLAVAGRRHARRRDMGVAMSLDVEGGGGGGDWACRAVEGLAGAGMGGEAGGEMPLKKNKQRSRRVRDLDHLGRHPPRPPEIESSGNPRSNMQGGKPGWVDAREQNWSRTRSWSSLETGRRSSVPVEDTSMLASRDSTLERGRRSSVPVEDTSMLASRDSTRRRSCEQTLVGDRAIGGIGRELSQPLTSVPLVGPQSEKLGKHERRLDRLRNAGTGEVGRIATVFEERRTNALCPQSPGAARLEIFANDILRPPGRYARRRDRLGNQGVQKVGISTVDLTPKGARAQIASREMGGAVVRTPKNGQGLSICTSPAAFPLWNGVPSDHPAMLGRTRDDSGIGLRSPVKDGDDEHKDLYGNHFKDLYGPYGNHFGDALGRHIGRKGPGRAGKDMKEDMKEGMLLSDFRMPGHGERIAPHGARNRHKSHRPPGMVGVRARGDGGEVGAVLGNDESGLGNDIAWEVEAAAGGPQQGKARASFGAVDELDHFLVDHNIGGRGPRRGDSNVAAGGGGGGQGSNGVVKGGDRKGVAEDMDQLVLFGRAPSERAGKLGRPAKWEAPGPRVSALQARGRRERDNKAEGGDGLAGLEVAGSMMMGGQRLQF